MSKVFVILINCALTLILVLPYGTGYKVMVYYEKLQKVGSLPVILTLNLLTLPTVSGQIIGSKNTLIWRDILAN